MVDMFAVYKTEMKLLPNLVVIRLAVGMNEHIYPQILKSN